MNIVEVHKDKIAEKVHKAVYKHFEFVKKEIESSLSIGYDNIIKNFSVKLSEEEGLKLSIDLVDGLDTKGQNIIMVLAHGGIIRKKKGEFIRIPPNSILTTYIVG